MSTARRTLAVSLVFMAFAAAVQAATPVWSRSTQAADPAIVARVDAGAAQLALEQQTARSSVAVPGTSLYVAHDENDAASFAELVGTWRVDAEADGSHFRALQTFHSDGTFTETSDLHATLAEGPAHGAWWGSGYRYFLTFELFVFNLAQPVGIIRVRNLLEVDGPDHFTAWSVVDFIDPEGNVELAVGSGSFTGERIRALYVNPAP